VVGIAVPALEISHATLGYGGTPILSDLSVAIPPAAQVAVVGPNGAGKSTLFKALAGLASILEGTIRIYGRPLGSEEARVAYVPQRAEVDWQFPVTVLDVVLMGRYGHLGWLRWPRRTDREIAFRCLERLGIANLARHPIGELSGGQQQRVFLARALAQEPDVILLDEPFAGVDAPTQELALDLLSDLRDRGIPMLVSTHDLAQAISRFDLLMLLNRRLIAFGRPSEVVSPANLAQTFGSQALFYPNGGGLLAITDQCCPPEEVIEARGRARSRRVG